ncbi:hypothetical protein NW768_008260 [Fusarium equiseti]|uniref:Tubulin-specific chaperone A n=1 Tax=Fusarium equiseti TaxID=61235 RepID=A0ABQ8R6T1_FUSEQ|nr:hypothetical protein NW768_008260 [Fusarium equiseti]
MSTTNPSESSQANVPLAVATQTSSNNPALNTDAKYAQAMKEYDEALEERENEFNIRSAQKVELLKARYEKLHTKLMSLTDVSRIPKGGKLAIADYFRQVQLLFEELEETRDALGDDLDKKDPELLQFLGKVGLEH